MGEIADLTKAEIERIEQAKADIKAALVAKGASVSSSKKISDYADIISGLTIGGRSFSTTFENQSFAHTGLPQLPILVIYSDPNDGMKMEVVPVGETISLEIVLYSPIVVMPYTDIAGMIDGYNNGRYLYWKTSGSGFVRFAATEVSAVIYATNDVLEGSSFGAHWI